MNSGAQTMAEGPATQSVKEAASKVERMAEEAKKTGRQYETFAKEWAKYANKYEHKYANPSHVRRYYRGGPRFIFGAMIGVLGGYWLSKHYTVVRKEHAEYVGEGRHGHWAQRRLPAGEHTAGSVHNLDNTNRSSGTSAEHK